MPAEITVPADLVKTARRLVLDGEIISDELVAWVDEWRRFTGAIEALYAGGDVPDQVWVSTGANVVAALAMRMAWRLDPDNESLSGDEHDRHVVSALTQWNAARDDDE